MGEVKVLQPPIRIIRRQEIYYVKFGDGHGSEQGGERPALIVQNDIGNRYSKTTMVVPLSTQLKAMHMPTHIFLGKSAGLKKQSITLVEQMRCIDKDRIGAYIGRLDDQIMVEIDEAMKILLAVQSPRHQAS